jgi:hypothetical protein
MKLRKLAAIVAAGWMVSAQAPVMGEVGEAFIRAVREKNGAKVEQLLGDNAPT